MLKLKLIGFMGIVLLLLSGFFTFTSASTIEGGDVTSMGEADVLLDIAFLIDTSGSMSDEAAGITALMGGVVNNLECPDCNVWVRADFYGIGGTWASSLFDTNMDYITGHSSDTLTNNAEDNAPAVTDMINYASFWSSDDSTGDQEYYRAIVTIGDEGTEDGYEPSGINDADWAAADVANQAAIDGGFFIFSLTGTPWSTYEWDAANMQAVFSAMAVGGTGGSSNQYILENTGGTFATTSSETLQGDIEAIICIAGSGGTGSGTEPVPEPGTILLMGVGLAGLAFYKRKRK